MTLEYSISEKGWPVEIHTPILDITEEDKKELCELLLNNVVIYWKKQNLTPQQELDFCKSIGRYHYDDVDWKELWNTLTDETKSTFLYEYPGILRVTGKPGITGKPGHFSHKEELGWHSDSIWNPNRKNCIWLYAVSGTKGSITRYINNILVYESLPNDLKEIYNNYEVQFYGNRFKKDFETLSYKKAIKRDEEMKELGIFHKLVLDNGYGRKGLFLSPHQLGIVKGMSEEDSLQWANEMLEYMTKPEFVYSHRWEDGDVVISEQTFSVHMRDSFEDMEKRYLHHIQFNMNNIIPNLKYEGYNGKL